MNSLLLSIHSLLLTAVPDSTTVAYQINRFFNTMVGNLSQVGESIEGNFATDVAQEVAAVCVLFYLGWEMWPVIMGRRAPDVTKLLRPVLIAGVISAWPFFFLSFEGIKTSLADGGRTLYNTQQNSIMAAEKAMAVNIERIDSIRKKDLVTYLAANSNIDGLDKTSLESKEYAELRDEYIDQEIKEGRQNRFAAGMVEFSNFICTIIENILKWIGQIALQAFFCGLLVVGDFGTIVLGIFGPVMFALSVSDAFKNHWAKWIEKYLCISLYPCLGYLAMAYVNWMILYYLEVQCNIGETAVSDWEKFVSVSYNHFGLIINYLVALFTGCYVMQAVPELARAIFPGPSGHAASSAGMFVSGMTMAVAGGTVKLAVDAAKTTVGLTGAAVGAAKRGDSSTDEIKDGQKNSKNNSKRADDNYSKDNSRADQEKARKSDILNYANPFRWFVKPPIFGWAKNVHAELDKAERKNSRRSERKQTNTTNSYKSGGNRQSTDTGSSGAVGYKRSGSSHNSHSSQNKNSSSYAPKQQASYQRRGAYFQQNKWRYRVSPAKLRHYWGNTMGFLANFVLADDSNVNPQAWATAVGSIKKGTRSVYSLPWLFARHYQKHSGNGTYQAINQWQKERSSDMVFVRRPSVGGYSYQTYGEEAQNLAKLTGEKVRYVNVAGQKVATFSLNKHNLQPVIHRLNEMGISVNVINQKGKSLYYKENISFDKMDALSDIKKTLEKLGGNINFKTPQNDFHTEQTGNGFDNNLSQELSITGISTDAYGALHTTVKDNEGNTQQIYLDRLKEEDLQRLAEVVSTLTKDSDEIEIRKLNEENDNLDNINDEFGFAENESGIYAGKSTVRENGTDKTDAQHPSERPQKAPTEVNNNENEDEKDTRINETENKNINNKEKEKETKPKFIDPLQQLKQEWAWVNTTPLGEWRKTSGKAAGFIGGSALLLMRSNKYGRAAVGAANRVSSFFGWNDKTQADIHKDLRAGLEYRWHFNMTIKDNVDFRKRHRGLPVSFTLKRSKEQVIRRGRGIHFNGVDFRNRTGFQKVANTGWRFTKWTVKAAFKTGAYALSVATGQRPLINISAVGAWGFKKSYNGIRWMARQTTARNAVIAWKREDKHNYVIVNRSGLQGNRYQTYGEDAVAIARILHKERDLRVLHIGQGNSFSSGGFFDKNAVPSLTLTKDDLSRLKAVLDRRGLTMDVINTRGCSMLSRNSELATALGIHNATASNGAGNPSTPNDPNVKTTNNQGSNNPQDHNTRQDQQPSGPTAPDVSDTPNDPTGPNTQGTSNGTASPSSPESSSSQTTPNPTNSAAADGHSASGKTNDPIVLDYSSKDAIVKNKTFEIKDVFGKTIYLVTGETLQSCLENMVRQGYSLASLDLSKADLRDANLKGADLRDANLTEANLRGARLQKASLRNADLTKANLRVAKLGKADLSKAQLSYADLRDADLKKADTSHSIFDNADLRGTIFDKRSDNPNKPS